MFDKLTYTIRGRKPDNNYRWSKWQKRAKNFVLSFEINERYQRLLETKRKLKQVNNEFSQIIEDDIIFRLCFEHINRLVDHAGRRKQKVSNGKIKRIKSTSNNEKVTWDCVPINPKWIINTTTTLIPEKAQRVLQMGEKFAAQSPKLPLASIITDVEHAINQTRISEEKKNAIRQKVTHHLRRTNNQDSRAIQRKQCISGLQEDIIMTKNFLKEHPHLLVLKADKGNTTVIMTKSDYQARIENLLNDPTTYEPQTSDPTASLQKEANGFIDDMHKKGYIDFNVKKYMTRHNSLAPKFYGLPKIHKQNYPLRPVVSFTKSPLYSLSSFTANILSQARDDTHNIRSSEDLIIRLENVTLEDDSIMISFDAIAMYTNIMVDLALSCIEKRWKDVKPFTALDKDLFFKILTFCLGNSYFIYNKTVYKQKTGLSMGSPLSAIVSEMVMDEIFDTISKRFNENIIFMTKFVDDSLFFMKEEICDDVLMTLNSFNNRLKFTCEKSKDSMNFLDVTCIRSSDNSILFRHYTKPTYTGRLIHSLSHQPPALKLNTAVNIKDKWLKLSSEIYHKDIRRKLCNVLLDNGYSVNFIKSVFNFRHKSKTNNLHRKFYSVHYTGGSSFIIRKILKNLGSDVTIAFKNHNTFKNRFFSHIKDPVPLGKQSELVYHIPCSECPLSYIGETMQYLSKRLSQHKYDEKKGNDETALAKHAKETGHHFDFEKASILAYEKNNKKRKLREVAEIIKNKNTVNYKRDSEKMDTMYSSVINNL